MTIILAPRRDEHLTENGFPVLRLSIFFEGMATEVNALHDAEGDFGPVMAQQNALISKLSKRLDDLEVSNDSDVLNSRLTAVASSLKRLISDLIDAVKGLDTTQSAIEAHSMQEKLFKEAQLLGERFEEAFETGITPRDIS